MTNLQLWLAIALPSILIVVAWLSQNSRFSAMDARFDRMDRRMDVSDSRVEKLDQKLEQRFDQVIASGHRDALEIMRAMTALHERVAVVEAKQDS